MVRLLTRYGDKKKVVTIYHRWDVPGEIAGYDCTKDDVGKFLPFDDGSGWFTRIIGVSDMAIKTESGTIRRDDIVHCSRIKWVGGYYSGVPSGEEHPLVRPYTPREKRLSTQIIQGTLPSGKHITPRIKMLTMDRLQEKADEAGVTPGYVVGRLKTWADSDKSRHAFQALTALARISGVELNQKTGSEHKPVIGLFQQNNITIQGRRRAEADSALPQAPSSAALPPLSQIREIAETAGITDAEVIE